MEEAWCMLEEGDWCMKPVRKTLRILIRGGKQGICTLRVGSG